MATRERSLSLFNDDEIIKGVAFIGNKNWYHKANILINDTVNDNNGVLTLYGIFFNEKLYNSVQSSYNEKSLIDIYTDICTKTDLGLYLIENDKLTNNLPLILNPNISYLNLINDLINNNDIELQTPIEYVVGYICKGLLDSQVIKGGVKGRNTPNQELSK